MLLIHMGEYSGLGRSMMNHARWSSNDEGGKGDINHNDGPVVG